ncbi:MAG: hypothetical protein HXX16_02350 [Bacteroidales bacterium]|jgi:hypothetical protein|nr:hypothetical protein [Bacteroidales bacterium]
MKYIRLDLDLEQFRNLIVGLDDVQNDYKIAGNTSKADIYSKLLTSILIQKAFQDYALIQAQRALNLKIKLE